MTDNEKVRDTSGSHITQKDRKWRDFFGRNSETSDPRDRDERDSDSGLPTRWSMGILNDKRTHEVPGSVLLLSGHRNEPLGLQNAPARTTTSTLPQPPAQPAPVIEPQFRKESSNTQSSDGKKKTKDGSIILEPQPHDSSNDPLNWPTWRRDAALLSLGLFCLLGGGMTPVLAAGFTNIEAQFDVSAPRVALTTGLFMMGLGVGSVFASPTAILYGKRPVYLTGAILFILCAVWCAASESFISLLVGRIFMGIAVSPVECLPSATIAEIYFLHERAFRIGVYTLLLLSGKNLIPLVSAAIIQTLGWRWVFWVVAFVVGFCFALLFFFVPETFWDRTPQPKDRSVSRKSSHRSIRLSFFTNHGKDSKRSSQVLNPQILHSVDGPADDVSLRRSGSINSQASVKIGLSRTPQRALHIGFAPDDVADEPEAKTSRTVLPEPKNYDASSDSDNFSELPNVESGRQIIPQSTSRRSNRDHLSLATIFRSPSPPRSFPLSPARHSQEARVNPLGFAPSTPSLHNFNSPFYTGIERSDSDYLNRGRRSASPKRGEAPEISTATNSGTSTGLSEKSAPRRYTEILANSPRRSFISELRPCNGRLHQDNWLRVAIRPFILYCYPAVLWSAVVYACSIGWLIVLSESVSTIYRDKDTYNFSALSAGLIYISPFIGGVLGTAVAGRVSDVIVKFMSKKNGGLYEPEFRLVMAIPVAITTSIGLMGYGWSAQIHDSWIVPTIFFGIISFGCSLGSTTAITFCVDSYRQYAGEALVTLNFSKNIFHGLVFSLFFNSWLDSDGSRIVFIALGIIQLGFLVFTIPMYIFGKRARMWTVRMNFMERF